jgi:hypothetical protein
MAHAFQNRLENFGIAQRMLAFNADNISSNDTQTEQLAKLDNSFEPSCFNHTIQLAVKTLLSPFNTGISTKCAEENIVASDDDVSLPDLVEISHDEDED